MVVEWGVIQGIVVKCVLCDAPVGGRLGSEEGGSMQEIGSQEGGGCQEGLLGVVKKRCARRSRDGFRG